METFALKCEDSPKGKKATGPRQLVLVDARRVNVVLDLGRCDLMMSLNFMMVQKWNFSFLG